jgi:hypothetical protein
MLGATCLSVIVVNLDVTTLNIALPAISVALHAGTGDLQWLVDAYSLVLACYLTHVVWVFRGCLCCPASW